ncbi:MAG: DHH family phosphoesterase [Candidatus Lokiarchaeota archaeon]|nr:DHH family phosphoesterase [Candidatus Lokiarchaeota archaeon]
MLKNKIDNFLYLLNKKKILIISHDLVDLDGFSSVIALEFILHQYLSDIETHLYFNGFSNSTNLMIEIIEKKYPNYKINYLNSIDDLKVDSIIILDANKLHQVTLPKHLKENNNISYFYIDHHYTEESQLEPHDTEQKIILDNYSSTAEIVYEISQEYNISFIKQIRYFLIAGILTDSGYFRFGNNNTIRTISKLLQNDIHYQEILNMLSNRIDLSEKIARIKGAQRIELIRQNNWLIGRTYVSSFEASVANILLKIGFDVVIVISDKDDFYRLSLRAKKSICSSTGLHLGKILETISKEYNVEGGGHDGAAGIILKKDSKNIIDIIIERIKDVFLEYNKKEFNS